MPYPQEGPDNAAGKTTWCPACGSAVVIPAPDSDIVLEVIEHPKSRKRKRVVAEDVLEDADLVSVDNKVRPRSAEGTSRTRPCKYCKNPVAPGAVTCPSCGGSAPYPIGCLLLIGAGVVFALVQGLLT